jgi:hypothetical protein
MEVRLAIAPTALSALVHAKPTLTVASERLGYSHG